MPRILGQDISPLGAFGSIRGFMSVVREIDFDEVRERAETPPKVLVIAASEDEAETCAAAVFGDDATRHVDLRSERLGDVDAQRFDAIVAAETGGERLFDDVRKAAGNDGERKVIRAIVADGALAATDIAKIRDAIVRVDIDRAPAFGRTFPALRAAAVKVIVDEASRANAQFALVSNAPAVIPIVGGLVAASADLIVLTKNQVMMVFKVAAIHNRDLGNQLAIMRELAPVVGSGFLWRTIAREAASFVPLAAGTLPKVAIAYAGTTVMGRAADYYYRFGKKPSREQLKSFTAKANDLASRMSLNKDDGSTADTEPDVSAEVGAKDEAVVS